MPATRSSARLASKAGSGSSAASSSTAAGSKHKAESGSSPAAKRSKKTQEKEQKTIEETISPDKHEEKPANGIGINQAKADVEMKEPEPAAEKEQDKSPDFAQPQSEEKLEKEQNGVQEAKADVEIKEAESAATKEEEKPQEPAEPRPEEKAGEEKPEEKENGVKESMTDVEMKEPEKIASVYDAKSQEPAVTKFQERSGETVEKRPEEKVEERPQVKPQEKSEDKSEEKPNGAVEKKSEPQEDNEKPAGHITNGEAAVEPKAREGKIPSNILEKGIIYFFFRGRVGIDDPTNVGDIARSYIIIRPIPHDAKLGQGPVGDTGNSRLLALPKKVLPASGKDRFMTFVEKSHTSFKQLKDDFISSSDYDTKTAGVRHTPAATPVGEGVYSITTTGRENHLAYILTIPSELGEVQKDMGLRERGSFIISTRNPAYPAPNNASLPEGPSYPQDVMDSFRSLRWQATTPKHLDFENTQFILIGESRGLESATQKQEDEQGKEAPKEEMEKLEDEDEHRVEGLKGDESAAIFADLELSSKGYHGLQTTWAD